MEKFILNFLTWIFIFGGLYAFAVGFAKSIGNGTPAEYGVMGIGGGFWLLSASITIYIRKKIENK